MTSTVELQVTKFPQQSMLGDIYYTPLDQTTGYKAPKNNWLN